MNADARFKFAYLVSANKAESVLILAGTAMLLSFGFFFCQAQDVNYITIYDFAHRYVWGGLFMLYAVTKLGTYFDYLPYGARIICSIAGLWMWNFLLLSFTVFDTTAITPTELLLVYPVVIEAWLLLSCSAEKKRCSCD